MSTLAHPLYQHNKSDERYFGWSPPGLFKNAGKERCRQVEAEILRICVVKTPKDEFTRREAVQVYFEVCFFPNLYKALLTPLFVYMYIFSYTFLLTFGLIGSQYKLLLISSSISGSSIDKVSWLRIMHPTPLKYLRCSCWLKLYTLSSTPHARPFGQPISFIRLLTLLLQSVLLRSTSGLIPEDSVCVQTI